MSSPETARPIAEPGPTPEIFITNVGKIEHVGNFVRLWLCSPETLAGCESDGALNVVKVKLILPKTALAPSIADLIVASYDSTAGAEVRRLPS